MIEIRTFSGAEIFPCRFEGFLYRLRFKTADALGDL